MVHNNARLAAWKTSEAAFAKKYGNTWSNLTDAKKNKIKEQYFAAYDKTPKDITAVEKAALSGLTSYIGTSA